MTPSGDGYPIDLAEEIIDLAGSFLEADRGSQCRAETQTGVLRRAEILFHSVSCTQVRQVNASLIVTRLAG